MPIEKFSISQLVTEQRNHFSKGKTRGLTERLETLRTLKAAILAFEPELAAALNKDLGKSQMEVITTEIGITLLEIKTAMSQLQRWMRRESVATNWLNPGARSYIIKEPYGCSLILAPWNYPFQLAIAPTIGALAAGNTVILKPSEIAQHTSEVLKRMVDTYFDPRVLSVVLGGIEETHALLDQRFDKIFFTGSPAVGRIIMEKAARFLTPLTLELGGKSPCIVDSDADLELAAKRILFGKGINAGQTCIAPDYLLVHEAVKAEFCQVFKRVCQSFYGEVSHQSLHLGHIINEKHFQRLVSYLDNGHILHGGTYDVSSSRMDITLMAVEDVNTQVMQDEIFGPILPLVVYHKVSDIVEIISRHPDPLALYIFSKNQTLIDYILHAVPFGGGCVNDTIMHITNDNLPFGGRGTSGMGSYHGKSSFDAFTHEKSILDASHTLDFKLKYPPYGNKVVKRLKKLLIR